MASYQRLSGTKRRKRYLAEAPDSFKSDGIPVVLDASKDTMLLYDEHGFSLKIVSLKRPDPSRQRTSVASHDAG